MFDIGFSEIIVCAVVALIVIGPERMPEAVRTMGLWIGRFKRSIRETRQEIEKQIGVEDIRRQLHNEDIMRSLEKARTDINNELNSVIEHVQTSTDLESEERNKTRTYTHENGLPDHSHTHENGLPHNKQDPDIIKHSESTIIPTAPEATHTPTEKPKTPL